MMQAQAARQNTSIYLSIPGLPPSTNHAFVNLPRGGRCLSREGNVWKAGVMLAVACCYTRARAIVGTVEVELSFYSEKWLTKAGTPRKIDVANLEKLFVDAVFSQLGMDDSNIWRLTLRKLNGPEASVIRIIALDLPQ
jgi:hypothetical protein